MKQFILINIILIFVGIMVLAISATAGRRDQSALKESLDYLKDVPEISWVVFDRNNVYIGFSEQVNDVGSICRGAAVNGNRAYGFGVHVYAVDGYQADWKKSKHYCTATARHGKVIRSNCR